MSVHHLDVPRFLFGNPSEISTAARTDPRTAFAHKDGVTVSTLRFTGIVLTAPMGDVLSGPREKGFDIPITWQVEGADGVAQRTIGRLIGPERGDGEAAINETTRQG